MACGTCSGTSKKTNSCSCKSKSYTSSIKYDGEKLVCNKDEENKFTIRSCSKLNDVISTLAENICELWNSAISVDYISNVELEGTILNFTGVGNAFSGLVDLSSILTPPLSTSLYNSDDIFTGGAIANERTVDMANYKIGWINNSQWGIGVAANAVGVSTEVGGINDTTAQFHVAGAIRTDNWYHGRYGLLLHQTGNQNNVFCGFETGENITTGYSNIGLGFRAGNNLTEGHNNIYVGYESGASQQLSDYNISIGNFSFKGNNINSRDNTVLGHNALNRSNQVSAAIYQNTVIGSYALGLSGTLSSTVTEIYNNVVVGRSAGQNLIGANNVIIGDTSSNGASFNGSSNVIIGSNSGRYNSGSNNVFIGLSSGTNYTSFGSGNKNDNIAIGRQSDVYSGVIGSIVLGASAFSPENGQCIIGSTERKISNFIYGNGYFKNGPFSDTYHFATTSVKFGVYDTLVAFNDTNNNSLHRISAGSGTGTGKGGDVSLAAYLPTTTGNAQGNLTDLLKVLGSTVVDQTTNVEIVFDNGGVLTTRKIEVGAIDSAGAGYRQLRVLN